MPICPEDGVQLIRFETDISAGGYIFWECPRHKGRYLGWGMLGLIPIPTAVISNPPSGFKQVTNLYSNADNQLVIIDTEGEYTGGGGGSGDMTYTELNSNNISAGNLNLSDANWDVSKSKVDYISIKVASGTVTDFDIAIYEKDTFQEADKRYEAKGLNSTDNWEDDLEWIYIDDDNSKEVHLKITQNSGTGTYNFQIRGTKLI